MATKHKQRPQRGVAGLLQQAQRSFDKGDFKQALKDAKVCHRQQPGPETRQLLEQAYLARANQLYRAGLRDEARAVAESLAALGATVPSVSEKLPELLIALGLFDRMATKGGTARSLEDDSALRAAAADHAVLRPEQAPASLPGIRQGAQTVRRALAALENRQEAEALALLKEIPRASPFADWKYLVRGLAAYYREDWPEMTANWERLDPQRLAARVAAPLRALADPALAAAGDGPMASRLMRLAEEILGGPALARLQKLQDHVAAGRWPEAVKLLRDAGPLFRQIDAGLPQRVAMVLCETFVRKGNPAAVSELAGVAEPPPIDPHWNRAVAMAWERAGEDDEPAAEQHWRAYAEDLVRVECLAPEERVLARALVWLRLGRLLVEESCELCPTCGVRHEPDKATLSRAVKCFEKSLKLAPELLIAYQGLAQAFAECQEPEKAAATYRRLIDRFPENLEALVHLAAHYMKRDEPLEARDFVLRAQRLKPLDAQIKSMVLKVHLAAARQHALAGHWTEGRAELAAAERLSSQHADGYRLLVRQAALEFKAGEFGLGHRLLDRAGSALGESAPVWLLMAIEGIRYAMPKAVAADFEYRWLKALKKSRNSRAAGEMCRIAAEEASGGASYAGQAKHVQELLDFLGRCSRVKWQAPDLRSVLEFLVVWEHREGRGRDASADNPSPVTRLLEGLVAKARSEFPEGAFFQLLAGEREIRKGPWACDRSFARDCFQRTLALLAGANDANSSAWAKRAKEKLHFLDEVGERMEGADGPLPYIGADDDEEDEEEDEDDAPFDAFGSDDDDDDDGDWTPPSFSGPPGKLFAEFARICRAAGLDPEDILDRAARGMPLRFSRREGGSKTKRKRRK